MKTFSIITIVLFSVLFLNAQTKDEIIIGTGTILNEGYPIAPSFDYTYSQTIYLQSEIGDADVISKIWYNFGGVSLLESNDWTIYIGHTTKSKFDSIADWIDINTLTQVYSSSFTPPPQYTTGWIEFDISDFNYNGTDNLVIAIDENSVGNDGYLDNYFYCSSVSNKRSLMDRSDSENYDPTDPPSNPFWEAFIPNIKLFKGVYPTTDASLTQIISPIGFNWKWDSGIKDVIVNLQNEGTGNLTNATINWKINDIAQTPYNWTGNLIVGASETVNIGSYNFSSANSYDITAEVIAVSDGNTANNITNETYNVINSFTTNYSEGFESFLYHNTPDFWSVETDVVAWIVDDRISHSGENCIRTFFDEDQAKNDWIFTPYFKLVGGSQYSISFWVRAPGWDGTPESLEFYVGNSTNSDGMTDLIWSDNNMLIDWTEITTTFTPLTTSNYVFGWHANSVANVDDIAIDDLSIIGETASVKNLKNNIISVYPNPTTEILNIKTNSKYDLQVTNSVGKLILNRVVNNSALVTLKGKGIYFFKFSNKNNTFIKKVIVK